MTWKSTAVLTGVTALAGWLANAPPWAGTPAVDRPPQSVRSSSMAPDIQREAARLRDRMHENAPFQHPARNPFKFQARPAAPIRPVAAAPTYEPLPPMPADHIPNLTLTAIATDLVDGAPQRIAVLSTPEGVVLVKEGETIAGQYRVEVIGEDGVELVSLSDGAVRRFALRP